MMSGSRWACWSWCCLVLLFVSLVYGSSQSKTDESSLEQLKRQKRQIFRSSIDAIPDSPIIEDNQQQQTKQVRSERKSNMQPGLLASRMKGHSKAESACDQGSGGKQGCKKDVTRSPENDIGYVQSESINIGLNPPKQSDSLKQFKKDIKQKINNFRFFVKPTDNPNDDIEIVLWKMVNFMKEKHNILLSVTGGLIRDLAMQVPPNDVDIEFTIPELPDSDHESIQAKIEPALKSYFDSIGLNNHYKIEVESKNRLLFKVTFVRKDIMNPDDPSLETEGITYPYFNFHFDFTPRMRQCSTMNRDRCVPIKGVFTLDNIEYDTHKRRFTEESSTGLRDLMAKRLRIDPTVNKAEWFGSNARNFADFNSAVSRWIRALRYLSTEKYKMDSKLEQNIVESIQQCHHSTFDCRNMLENAMCKTICNLAKEKSHFTRIANGGGLTGCAYSNDERYHSNNYQHIPDNLRRFVTAIRTHIGLRLEEPQQWHQRCFSGYPDNDPLHLQM